MAELQNNQFELGGIVLGNSRFDSIFVEDWDEGVSEWQTHDSLNPVGNNRFFGRDYLHGPTWTWSLVINEETGSAAKDTLRALRAVWRNSERSREFMTDEPLRYRLAGETRIVYGRPRRFAVVDNTGLDQGVILVEAQFETTSPYSYEDAAQESELTIIPASAGGLVSPLVSPLTSALGSTRQGIIEDTGASVATPMEVIFVGPVTNPTAWGEGWKVGLETTIAWDETITVDTRRGTVTRSNGASAAGALTRGSWLEDAKLQPGPDMFYFSGTDPTGTAKCIIRWHAAEEL